MEEEEEENNSDDEDDSEGRAMKRGGSSSSSSSLNNLPKEDVDKLRHNACERRRQQTMNEAIQALQVHLPASNSKATKMAVVQRAAAALGHYKDLSTRLLRENAKIRKENDELRRAMGMGPSSVPQISQEEVDVPAPVPVQGPKKRPAPAIEVKGQGAGRASRKEGKAGGSSRGHQVKLLAVGVFFLVSLAHFGWLPGTTGAGSDGAVLRSLQSSLNSSSFLSLSILSLRAEMDFGVDVLVFLFHLFNLAWKAVFCLFALSVIVRSLEHTTITPEVLEAARKHRQQAEGLLLLGKSNPANEHVTAGLHLLGYGTFAQTDRYPPTLVLTSILCFCLEFFRQGLNRFFAGTVVDIALVHVKGAEAFYAEGSILIAQAFYIEAMKMQQQSVTALFFQFYRLLVALNNSEIGGAESQGMFQLLCFAISWITDLAILPWPLSLATLSTIYKQAAWSFSSSSIGPSDPSLLGRYFASVGVENVRKGNWQQADFFFSESLKHTEDNPNLRRAILLGLAFARHFGSHNEDEVTDLMKQIQESADKSQDRRWVFTVEVYVALNLLREDPTPEGDRRALELLEAVFVDDSWSVYGLKQSLDLDKTGWALAKLRCGQLEEAVRIALEVGVDSAPIVFLFAFDYFFLDFQCELYLSLLRLRLERAADTLPPNMPGEAELVGHCQKRLGHLANLALTHEFASASHLLRKGQFLLITGRRTEAKASLLRAMDLATTFKMKVDQNRIGLLLAELEAPIKA